MYPPLNREFPPVFDGHEDFITAIKPRGGAFGMTVDSRMHAPWRVLYFGFTYAPGDGIIGRAASWSDILWRALRSTGTTLLARS